VDVRSRVRTAFGMTLVHVCVRGPPFGGVTPMGRLCGVSSGWTMLNCGDGGTLVSVLTLGGMVMFLGASLSGGMRVGGAW
jgi:hypothetical protein